MLLMVYNGINNGKWGHCTMIELNDVEKIYIKYYIKMDGMNGRIIDNKIVVMKGESLK